MAGAAIVPRFSPVFLCKAPSRLAPCQSHRPGSRGLLSAFPAPVAIAIPEQRSPGGTRHETFDDDGMVIGDGRGPGRSPSRGEDAPVVPPREGTSETIKLFDGKDLDGWEGHETYWSVKDGVIVGKNTEPVKVSTYLLTKQKYTDFRLTAKVKLVESEMHSGIAFWGRNRPGEGRPVHLRRPPRDVPLGLGHVRPLRPERPAGRRRARPRRSASSTTGTTWRSSPRATASASPSTASQVVDWRDPEPDRIKEGPIGLQLHSNKVPQEVQFKDLVLETFPKEDRLLTVK